MSTIIRIIYELDVKPGKTQQCHEAWRAIVAAHANDGALGSALFEDPEIANRLVAISRWKSLEHWERGRKDEHAPEAYARFRDALVEVVSKRILREIDVLS